MNSADAWYEEDETSDDNLAALLGLSVELVNTMSEAASELEAAKERHPSGFIGTGAVFDTVLTAVDRCDAECSAAAMYRLREAKGNRVLDFCGHHNRKHGAALAASGWKVDGTNPSLIQELYNSNRLKGGDHA